MVVPGQVDQLALHQVGISGDTVWVGRHVEADLHWGEGDGELVLPGDQVGGGKDKVEISQEVMGRNAGIERIVEEGVLGHEHGKLVVGGEPDQLVLAWE